MAEDFSKAGTKCDFADDYSGGNSWAISECDSGRTSLDTLGGKSRGNSRGTSWGTSRGTSRGTPGDAS
ncbi:hypothetical protein ANO11243_001070 [Dothideomycetidae sp. 11243]|nr:hypothetical protein ANO11243_001070 [fungal sp. No.11243]